MASDVVLLVNNAFEDFTLDSSGAIATHVAMTRSAANRVGAAPLVVTRAPRRTPLDDGPRLDVPVLVSPTGLVLRVLDKVCRTFGWQGFGSLRHYRRLRWVLRGQVPSGSTVVLHNDPDIADRLAAAAPDLRVVHVWHNVLVHGRSRHARVKHLAVSDWLARAVMEAGCSPVLPFLLPNGVDAATFHPTAEGGRLPGPLTVSFLGRTGREKGLDVLLQALVRVTLPAEGLRLLVIGSNTWAELIEDGYQQELRAAMELLRSRGILVETTGHVGRPGVPGLLRGSDVHVVPSRWQDPAPLVLMEAMASGLAVVAARSGGMPEYGADAATWFEREDVDGLVEALEPLLVDSSLRRRRASAARARAEELSWDRTWQVLVGHMESR